MPDCLGDHTPRRLLRGISRTSSCSASPWSLALESLTPDFIEECNDGDFDELAEEFAPCANAMALVSSSADIIVDTY